MTFTVAVVDPSPMWRAEYADLIGKLGGTVVAEDDGSNAFAKIAESRPDVALSESRLRPVDGLAVMDAAQRCGLPTKFCFIANRPDSRSVYSALQRGAMGYVSKQTRASDIATAVGDVAAGCPAISQDMLKMIEREIRRVAVVTPPLTKRETEVLRLIVEDQVDQIASTLVIQPVTARKHIQSLRAKLDVKTTAGLVAEAFRRGLAE